MATDLDDFVLADMIRVSASLRALASDSPSVEAFAGRLCTFFHELFRSSDGRSQTALTRLYLTQSAADLPEPERLFAVPDATNRGDLRCLTLMGSAGDDPAWNDRRQSAGHLAIPLHDTTRVSGLPMVSGLLRQMGIEIADVVEPGGLVMDLDEHRYGVFHVPDAEGSPLIPAQDFVTHHRVRSVVGFGGVLPDGDMYAVVIFAKVTISRETAEIFQTLAPSITLDLVDLLEAPVFDGGASPRPSTVPPTDRSMARESLLRSLLEVHERVASEESDRARAETRRTREALANAQEQAETSAALARTLQRSLLPHELPHIRGLAAAAYFRPAGDGSEIGGDFYDLFAVRRGVWGLVLGDVSGKGAVAASLTALARHTVRAAAMRAKTCVEVLRVLNDATVRQDIAEERYLTAMFAFLRRNGDRLEINLCLGGHAPPLLQSRGGQVSPVGAVGQPLGLFVSADLTETRFDMVPGDRLVAFTDGITEARRGGEMFGVERAASSVLDSADLPIEAAVKGLAHAVAAFQGEQASDDIAIVGIENAG